MSLVFTCPNCQEPLSLNTLIEHEAMREAFVLALEFPNGLGKQMLQYLGLFKPAKRKLSADRMANLLAEIIEPIKAAQVTRNGTTWPAPQAYWAIAFDETIKKKNDLTLPLKSHGYLYTIVAGLADKAAGQQEAKAEQGRQFGAVNSKPDHIGDVNKMVSKRKPKADPAPSALTKNRQGNQRIGNILKTLNTNKKEK